MANWTGLSRNMTTTYSNDRYVSTTTRTDRLSKVEPGNIIMGEGNNGDFSCIIVGEAVRFRGEYLAYRFIWGSTHDCQEHFNIGETYYLDSEFFRLMKVYIDVKHAVDGLKDELDEYNCIEFIRKFNKGHLHGF